MPWYDMWQTGSEKKACNPLKMKKRHHTFTEHYLVPAVLFLFNICLAHIIYAFAGGSAYSPVSKVALAAAFALLGCSLLLKKQALLTGSILFYVLIVIWI
jgi:hypothetical protein